MWAKGIWKHDLETNNWAKRDENGEWRGLHNGKLCSLYHLPDKVRLIKSRRFRCVGYVAMKEEARNALKILTGKSTRQYL